MPMIMNKSISQTKTRKENVIAGIVGAFLFSLIGGIVWVALDYIGFYAGISGLIGAVCAMQGYRIFGGKLSKKGVIISAGIALLVLILAWYGCLAKDVYEACKDWYAEGELDYLPSYGDCFRTAYLYLSEPEIAKSYLLSLGIGLVLAFVGSIGSIVNAFKKAGAEETVPPEEPDFAGTDYEEDPNEETADISSNPDQEKDHSSQEDGSGTSYMG